MMLPHQDAALPQKFVPNTELSLRASLSVPSGASTRCRHTAGKSLNSVRSGSTRRQPAVGLVWIHRTALGSSSTRCEGRLHPSPPQRWDRTLGAGPKAQLSPAASVELRAAVSRGEQ